MAQILDVLPGERVPSSRVPHSEKKQLKLGPGLHHIPPSIIKASVAGELHSDFRKNAIWVEYDGGRYIPRLNDLIVCTIHHSSAEIYHVTITPHAPLAMLPQLAFESATKKTRPILQSGDLVYARVSTTSSYLDAVELECVSATTGKADGLGPLKGGTVFDISLGFARRLMLGKKAGCVVLEEMGQRISFEVAVGRNGRVWVGSEEVRTVVAVGRALQQTDEQELDEKGQRKLVERVLKGL